MACFGGNRIHMKMKMFGLGFLTGVIITITLTFAFFHLGPF
jgi:hypothetical protein